MPDEADELTEYLRGDSALSRQYRREPANLPPPGLDRLILDAARPRRPKSARNSQRLAPLAFAASVFLSVALVLAIVFGPQAVKKNDDKPHVVQVRAFKTAPPRAGLASRERNPAAWLEDIEAMRRAGHDSEADLEMQRFRSAYPTYLIPSSE
jgi:hypothetical protein